MKWAGYTRKDTAKDLLTRNFTKDIDYIIQFFAPVTSGAKTGRGGVNKENIKLNVDCLKYFC